MYIHRYLFKNVTSLYMYLFGLEENTCVALIFRQVAGNAMLFGFFIYIFLSHDVSSGSDINAMYMY